MANGGDIRKQMIDHLKKRGALSKMELAKLLSIPEANIKYHAGVLIKEKKIMKDFTQQLKPDGKGTTIAVYSLNNFSGEKRFSGETSSNSIGARIEIKQNFSGEKLSNENFQMKNTPQISSQEYRDINAKLQLTLEQLTQEKQELHTKLSQALKDKKQVEWENKDALSAIDSYQEQEEELRKKIAELESQKAKVPSLSLILTKIETEKNDPSVQYLWKSLIRDKNATGGKGKATQRDLNIITAFYSYLKQFMEENQ